ncbi:hypothetical protein LSAT2_024850, partial [Lamellibrachia satsuma]
LCRLSENDISDPAAAKALCDSIKEMTSLRELRSFSSLSTQDDLQPLHIKLPPLRPTPHSSTESTVEPPVIITNDTHEATSSNKTSIRVPNINLSRVLDSPNRPDKRRQRAQQTNDDGFHLVSCKNYRKKVVQSVIGTRKGSHGNNELKVYGGRFLSVFISRLDPTESIDELSLYI